MVSHLIQRMTKALRLFIIAALLGGLALGLRLVPVAQAVPLTVNSLPPKPTYLTLLPDQATNLLPTETSHQFTAAVLSQYGTPMAGVVVSFSTDFGQFDGGVQYVEVQTDVLGVATVTITSTTVGTANIRAWIDDNSDDTYSTGELTDDPSTKTWQEEVHPDFGDAPDSYGTLLASNGARHIIVSGLHLGLTVDGEADGQPSANADGDDLDSNDDEDGVALQPILVPGTTAAVVVYVVVGPSGGKLDAWIDFDGNGVFDHPAEYLFASGSVSLAPGANPLSFQVPSGASTGSTYARFRLSINGGLPPTGPAPDGEVEDYRVEIQELPAGTGTVVLEKKTDPPGGGGFDFSNDFGIGIPDINLDDGVTLTIPYVPAGTYSVTEADPIPFGFDLTGLTCEDPDGGSSIDLAARTATIDLDAGETITCTFNNAERGTIVLRKQSDPPGGIGFDFINDFGIGIPGFSLDDGMTLTIPYVPSGTYSVTEADPVPPFDLIGLTCEDPDGGSSIDLAARTATIDLDAGETITCTFINGQGGSIIVEKQTDPDGAAGSFTFSGDAAGTISDGGQIVVSDLLPGSYTATEADPGPDFDLTAITCDDGNSSGNVGTRTATFNLEAGETVKCTFTNAQQHGTIIVEKQTNPNGSWGSFTFSGDAAGTIADGGQIVVANLLPGTYTATEADPGPDFDLTAITCDDDNSTGDVGTRTVTFNLEADETVKCTFTNARRSLQVSKELELPVGGLAAVDQIVRFNITVENDGGMTIDPLTLRDDYDSWCLRSRRAEVPPDVHGGMAGFLQWNDLGALPPGESMSLWVEFTANHACEEATNTATVETGGLTFEDEATVRILDTIARVGGFIFHDDNGNGVLNLPCRGTDVDPATCEPGLEEATAETTLPSGSFLRYTTNTSGWYSFNLLDPGTYHVEAAAPGGSWWTPTTAEECDATVANNWDQVFCHFGYWWGLDWGQMDMTPAENQATLVPIQDVTISEWNVANEGHNEHLRVRQPGVTSALLQFDPSGLPEGAEVVWAKLRLYSPFASNSTNRLYMTAYPLETMWTEDEVTWLQAATGMPWDAAGATGDHGDPVGWAWIDAPGWVEFDLNSDLLADWLADPVSNHGLLLRGEGSDNREVAYWFFSREYLNADAQPQLVVGYDGP